MGRSHSSYKLNTVKEAERSEACVQMCVFTSVTVRENQRNAKLDPLNVIEGENYLKQSMAEEITFVNIKL